MNYKGNKHNQQRPQNKDVTAKLIGGFGKWQLRICILMALLKIPSAWYQLNIIFLAPPQEFWCQTHVESDGVYYHRQQQNNPCLEIQANTSNGPSNYCTRFSYNTSIFKSTIVSEWDLVCSRQWLVQLSQAVLRWGILIGGLVFGIIADEYGRKTSLMAAIVIQSVAGFVSSVIPCYWGFVFNRFFLALASGGIAVVAFVNCMETVSGKWRILIPVITQLPFCVGDIIMATLAYWLRDWRKLELVLAMASSVFIIYWFYITESPRWLLAKGRVAEALDILKVAAKTNKKEFNPGNTENLINNINENFPNRPGFVVLLRSKNMRLKTFLLSTEWFCTGLSFYTFSQYLGSIGSNIFMTVAMSGFISIPGAIICVFVINKLGRKFTIAGFQLLTGICFILLLFIPKAVYTNDWPRLLCSGVALGGMAGSVPALYLYSGEIYPTLVRNVGVGYVVMFARIGSMIAPFCVTLGEVSPTLLLALLAALTLFQTVLVLPLPETKEQTINDPFE